MKIWKNLFGTNDKINAGEIAVAPGLLLPDAVIVESGNNANGHYIKYGNGWMICAGDNDKKLAFSNGQIMRYIWTYPEPFTTVLFTDYAFIHETRTVATTAYDWGAKGLQSCTNVSAEFRLWARVAGTFKAGETIPILCFAIGRWK